jgi:isocitrate lyase
VHFEDQLSSAKKCGHLGGKVLVSTGEAINKLVAARLAADVLGVPTVIIARTDADAANLLLSDHDPRDARFLTGERSSEGFFTSRPGSSKPSTAALLRALCRPDVVRDFQARSGRSAALRRGDSRQIPGKLLAYNCSPSFNWQAKLAPRR